MLRFALLLLATVFLANSAHAGWLDDLKAAKEKREAQRAVELKAMIEAGKMPPVRLNENQIAKLPGGLWQKPKIVWVGAGRQKDGKIFVCHVASITGDFGKTKLLLYSGTFDADGSYQKSYEATFASAPDVQRDCHKHGIVPPIKITYGQY